MYLLVSISGASSDEDERLLSVKWLVEVWWWINHVDSYRMLTLQMPRDTQYTSRTARSQSALSPSDILSRHHIRHAKTLNSPFSPVFWVCPTIHCQLWLNVLSCLPDAKAGWCEPTNARIPKRMIRQILIFCYIEVIWTLLTLQNDTGWSRITVLLQ